MNQERVFQVLVGPHVSEKAAIVADQSNQYVFKVAVDATKAEVKKSVEQGIDAEIVPLVPAFKETEQLPAPF